MGALGMREWVCDQYGSVHDGDVNAARNILALGMGVSQEECPSFRLGRMSSGYRAPKILL